MLELIRLEFHRMAKNEFGMGGLYKNLQNCGFALRGDSHSESSGDGIHCSVSTQRTRCTLRGFRWGCSLFWGVAMRNQFALPLMG